MEQKQLVIRRYTLPIYGIVVEIFEDGMGIISSTLPGHLRHLETMILALASADVDIDAPEIIRAITASVHASTLWYNDAREITDDYEIKASKSGPQPQLRVRVR